MIKLKKLIKEAAWDREFGEPLPTLKDVAEKHQTEEKESINEVLTDKLQTPSDVSYYNRDWEKVFEKWADRYVVEFGPRESDMYDWNDRSLYDKVVKEFNAEMGHVAAVLNKASKGLQDPYKKWNRILEKHRKKDRS